MNLSDSLQQSQCMNDAHAIERLAGALLQARDTSGLIAPPSRGVIGFDLNKGYQVGRILHELLVERGFRAVGRKIGFTNPVTWKEFNLDTPIWAHMYSQTVYFAQQSRMQLNLSGMVSPRIEPEIVLKLGRPVVGGDQPPEDLAECLEWVAIGFEIVDCHFPGWQFTAADAVADFGVHAALVIGAPLIVERSDLQMLPNKLQQLRVTLTLGSEIVAEGEGRNALGSPILALGHLSSAISALSWAPPLGVGEIITTGTLTPLPYIHRGECWKVEVAGAPLGSLILDLSD